MHPAQRLGDFQIVRELARGGMGIVYEAVQLSLGRPVALKVLPFAATVDSRQLQRFRIEAQAAALLHHTHIVPIYAVGCERGVHFYAMQLIDGQSLAVVITQLREKSGRAPLHGETSLDAPSGPHLDSTCDLGPTSVATSQNVRPYSFDGSKPLRTSEASRSTAEISAAMTAGSSQVSVGYVRRVARLMIQAADALAHAHLAGVVHRDIKPANLLLDAGGELWITDFGLAQLQADNGLTRSGDVLGTFRYMSPEQTGGQRTLLDHRSDIYSLGVTFYEMLTLEPAFAGQTHHELLYQILHTEPRSLRQLNRAVSPELETIVLKSLSKSPADRYATASEFAADIQRFLDHQPIRAKRPSLFDRTCKWSRRHPSLVVAGMLLLMVIAAASLISNQLIATEQKLTTEALDREKLRAAESEAHFKQAREAVDALFQVSEEELTDKPFDGARQRILEIVLSHYQDFIEQRRGDPASQAELAAVQAKVKRILHDLTVVQREMHLRLLDNNAVLDDLKLNDVQQAELRELTSAWADERRTFFAEMRDLTEAERQSRIVVIAQSHEQALAKVFTVAQQARFEQLSIQSQGLFAFKNPDVIKALTLTADQRTAVRAIEREMFADRFRGRGPGGPGGPGPGPGGPRGPGGPEPGGPDGPGDPRRGEPGKRPERPAGEPGKRPERREGEPDRPPARPEAGGPEARQPGPPRESHVPMQQWVAKALALLTPAQLQAWKTLTGEPFAGFDGDGFPGPRPH